MDARSESGADFFLRAYKHTNTIFANVTLINGGNPTKSVITQMPLNLKHSTIYQITAKTLS